MKYNPNKYYRIGYLVALILSFPFYWLTLTSDTMVHFSAVIMFSTGIILGNEFAFRFPRLVCKLYEEDKENNKDTIQPLIESISHILQVFIIISFVILEIFAMIKDNVLLFIVFILLYSLWLLLETKIVRIGKDKIVIGTHLIELDEIQDIIFNDKRIDIVLENKDKRIHHFFLGKKRDTIIEILKGVKEINVTKK